MLGGQEGVLGDREAGFGREVGGKLWGQERPSRKKRGGQEEGRQALMVMSPESCVGWAPSPGWGLSLGGQEDGGEGSACTRGVGEPEGDSLVRDAAHVAYRHLAGVAGIVLGPQVLQLQDLGLPLGSSGPVG